VHARFDISTDHVSGMECKSIVSAPIVHSGRTIAVLQVRVLVSTHVSPLRACLRRTGCFGSIQPRQVYNKIGAADTRAKDTHTRPASAGYNDDGGADEHAAASFTLPDEIALSTFVLHLGMAWHGMAWVG
jgi:hypothetical protein